MMRTEYFTFILLFALTSCETVHDVEPRYYDYFIKYYGQEGNQQGIDVEQVEDGFIVLGNSTTTSGDSKLLVIRVDRLGNRLWSQYFGGSGNNSAVAIEVDKNGDYVIAATVQPTGGDRDVMLLKVDPNGLKVDSALFGIAGEDEVAKSLLITQEGDYIVTGYTTNVDILKPGYTPATDFEDIYSIRTTPGLVQFERADWRRIYGFPGVDRGTEVVQKADGSFLFFGTTDKPPTTNSQQSGYNMFLFPAGDDGIAISSSPLQLFGTLSNESGSQLIRTSVGGYIMLGSSISSGLSKPYLARVGSANDFMSSGVVGANGNIEGIALVNSTNGGILMLGQITGNNNRDIYLAKLTFDGTINWEKTFGGLDRDTAGSILELEDGSIVFVGTITLDTQEKICLIKLTKEGEFKL